MKKRKVKKKPIVILILVILIIIGLVIGIVTIKNKPKKEEKKSFQIQDDYDYEVTIMFDSTGGEAVDTIKAQANEMVTLPTTNREGYKFIAWYNGDEELEERASFLKDTTLVAKWEASDGNEKTFRITFDTKGGSYIKSQVLNCDDPLSLPTGLTKDDYKFDGWTDKSGKAVTNSTKLECKDVTLYAKWSKIDTKGKKYTCPDGYTLSGDKCTLETTPTEACPSNTTSYNGGCLTLGGTVRKEPIRTCGTKTVITGLGYTREVQGTYISGACYYYEWQPVVDQATCTSQQHKWINNKCYAASDTNYQSKCSDPSNYLYISNPASIVKKSKLKEGCYPFSKKQAACPTDYVLSGDKCIKTIDATLK
jgi:uncharacterized repeat protein (TIGR02543 family)